MSEQTSRDIPHRDCRRPHILVIVRDEEYGKAVAAALRDSSVCAKHARTVDEFLDLNCRARVDLVLIEVDALDPDTLDNLLLLRTHFGEGPGTRIVAASNFVPGAFAELVETRGADLHMAKLNEPVAMAAALAIEFRNDA